MPERLRTGLAAMTDALFSAVELGSCRRNASPTTRPPVPMTTALLPLAGTVLLSAAAGLSAMREGNTPRRTLRSMAVESDTSFEAALSLTQEKAEAALKSAGAVTRELRKARAAAAHGQVRDLRRALEAAVGLAGDLRASAQQTRDSFDIDETAYLASGAYAKELLAMAPDQGVALYEEDERLLCYPSIVRVIPNDCVVEIDRKRERRLRPSVLLGLLAAVQQRPGKFRAAQLLESLADGYDLVVARGRKKPDAVVQLTEIWGVLTLLPGQAREYTRQEFARDLYQLDLSGAADTKDGRTLRWHASSGTRSSGVLSTVSRTGQQQRYWAVSFVAGPER